MNWRNAFLGCLIVGPLIVLLARGFGQDPHRVPSMLEGKPAPDFVLNALSGEAWALKQHLGKPTVVNFWSTWCEPCKYEHDILQQAATYYGDSVQFVGVVYQDTRENISAYLQQRRNVYTQLLDVDSKVAMDFGVAGVPETFFIDARGVIRRKHSGVLTGKLLFDQVTELQNHERAP